MDELLRAWETTFGCSTLPFGVAEVLLDDRGRPYDFAYRYINAAAASPFPRGCADSPSTT